MVALLLIVILVPADLRRQKPQIILSGTLARKYKAVFVCFTTKAVHLEVVSDLSTDAFLAAFDRFVARRGLPNDVFSDCGTNFVVSDRQLRSLIHRAGGQAAIGNARATCDGILIRLARLTSGGYGRRRSVPPSGYWYGSSTIIFLLMRSFRRFWRESKLYSIHALSRLPLQTRTTSTA